jgi:hypothetical protein
MNVARNSTVRARVRFRRAIIIFIALVGTCEASAPMARPLTARIAYSKAIVIGKVIKLESLPATRGPLENIWRPNTKVTVKVSEVLRGTVSDILTAEIAVSKYLPYKVSDEVYLFISETHEQGRVEVFEAAQGFNLRRSPVGGGPTEKYNDTVDQAVRKMVAAENHSQDAVMGYSPPFGPQGIAVILDLVNHADRDVRYFAISCLCELPISDETGSALISALEDNDKDVQKNAAFTLMRKKYIPAVEAIAEYARSLPETRLRREAFGFLASVAPDRYDYAASIQKSLSEMNPSAHDIFRESLRERSRSLHCWIGFNVDQDRKVSLVQHGPALQADELETFLERFTVPLPPDENLVPFSFTIRFGYTPDGGQRIDVDVF